jgi:hypothetical protein
MRIQRDVLQGNIFYSPALPKIRMKIHSDLEYLGKAETTRRVEYTDWEGGSPVDRESYLFTRTQDNRILEGVLIRISTLRAADGYWLPDLFARIKNKLDSGTMKIQGRRYQYSVFGSSRVFLRYEWDFLTDKGYLIPNCFMVKGLGRIVDADARTLMYILYMEDPSRFRGRKYSCRDWNNVNILTAEQKEFLKEFTDRSDKNVEIL